MSRLADPYCPQLRSALSPPARAGGRARSTTAARYIVIEGPQFSTRAESELFRSWGAAVIGMTAMPEARLAREAEMCYADLALATDYDCWHDVPRVGHRRPGDAEPGRAACRRPRPP